MELTSVSPFSLVRDTAYLDASTDYNIYFGSSGTTAACVLAVGPGERIDEVGISYVSSDGSPSAIISIEEMSSSVQGNPGTPPGSILAQSAPFDGGALAAGVNWIPLLTPYQNGSSETKIVAITIRYSGTGNNFSGSHRFAIRAAVPAESTALRLPYYMERHGSSGDLAAPFLGQVPLIAARDLNGRLIGGTLSYDSSGIYFTNTAQTTTLRCGNKWTVDYGCRLSGVSLLYAATDVGATFDLLVYVNGTLESTTHLDPLTLASTDAGSLLVSSQANIPIEPIELAAGDVVRLVIEGTSTDSVNVQVIDFGSASMRAAFVGGANMHACQGSATPVWIDTDTKTLAFIFPVIDQVAFAGGVIGQAANGMQRSVIYKNVEDQWVFFRLVTGTGAPINGVGAAALTINLTSAESGDDPDAETSAANDAVFFGDGVYGVQLTQSESNHDVVVLTVAHDVGKVSPVIIETSPQVPEVTVQPGSLALEN